MDERPRDFDLQSTGAAQGEPAKEPVTPPLKAAIRRARVEEAEHSEVLAELRGAEIARLEMLRDTLEPVLAEIPEDVDLFDTGLTQGPHPRLFIDMIGFIEMGRDRRLYRFLQDTRYGRVKIAESEKIDTMVKAVTNYIARRLVEREKALASDTAEDTPAARLQTAAKSGGTSTLEAKKPMEAKKSGEDFQQILSFTIDLLGSMVLFTLVSAGAYYLFTLAMGWMALHHH